MFNDLQDKLLHQFLLLYAGQIILTLHARGQPIKFQDWWYHFSMVSHIHS